MYNKEAFLTGNKAEVLVHPRLYLNEIPGNLNLIEKQKVSVTTVNDLGIEQTTDFDKVKFEHDRDLKVAFPIPVNLRTVTIKVSGQIKYMEGDKTENVQKNHTIEFNLHENTTRFTSMFLKNTIDGYQIYVKGKNGEPKEDMLIKV